MGELGLAKVSRFSNECRCPCIFRPPDSGTWIKLSGSHCRKRKRKIQSKDREKSIDTRTEAKKQISTVEMSQLGNVAVATSSLRHNARRMILRKVLQRRKGASHINAAMPGPQQVPGYLNDDSNWL